MEKIMKCIKCNCEVFETDQFCPSCGAPIPPVVANTSSTVNNTPPTQYGASLYNNIPGSQAQYNIHGDFSFNQPINYKDFYNAYASKKTKNWVIAFTVVCFITAATSVLSLISGNVFSLIDIIFYIICGILLLSLKKWGVALAATIYSSIGTILIVLEAGAATGIAALVCGIFCIVQLRKVNTAFKEYKSTGELPQNLI